MMPYGHFGQIPHFSGLSFPMGNCHLSPWAPGPGPPLTPCVTWGKPPAFSKPCFLVSEMR